MLESDPATNGSAAAASRALSAVSRAGGGAGVPQLGVVIPTKNSMPYLQRHVEGLRLWLDLAHEVVVVDSFSSDGTVEYLRQHLKHPQVTYTTHPPGLYASWNHGIAQVRSAYVYIATAGDLISHHGITELVRTAESLKCDVVISKPGFCDVSGHVAPNIQWPIDDVIAAIGLTEARRLDKLEAVVCAAAHAPGNLVGSCASDIFRTEVLRRFPFPTHFGTAGDGAWGLMHAAEVSWAVVPEKFSTFLCHPTNVSEEENRSYRDSSRMDEVLRFATEAWLKNGHITEQELTRIHWGEMLETLAEYLEVRSEYNRRRRGSFPWILQPGAWRARSRRGRLRSQLHELKHVALRQVGALAPETESSVAK
jgi:hypothetical protein